MYKLILLIILIIPFSVHANLENKNLIGEGSFHYFLWHIYDAKLYSNNNIFSFESPFYLTLEYKRKLYGHKIADSSAEEIRKLGFKDEVKLAAWHAQMTKIFPDVDNGTNLTGMYYPEKPTIFYKNGQEIGKIQDQEFGKWFFRIWLDERTSDPNLRKELLGDK